MRRTNITFCLGCLALVIANVTQYLLRRSGTVPESIADPVNGFLFGVAIATLLLSIVRMRRSGCAS
ncbi:MAG: hypothetical protein ACJ74H_02190 [Thermoanaerobaculia bacterium]